ncbi:Cell differentiation and development protein Fsr1 [Penicillium digitatum]|uniref:Cell differentiation and development protein Fsr1 n=3 Tax=Penicillium digitatum TaxID=36651 RepID=K9G9F7_PEND2|nr:Cell differentiation and development protein Fsr1 [Penicillium digitatum Pd1]EKV13510.1 Cell differentiation and development protein Fsr1 [Penicillium digitatum Pd1]EKV17702.1 Cell differentiation and development protein Fsr1 [Penicillium digitatum PHI26]QQK43661.1 Cell differentiation and development protein Fsr1 [Penicillium digitatum]
MAGIGGTAGAMDGSNGPQGTEYTLQGVMRFLQTEWHRHERDRNAWEIERAEMKSRIGRLEGDLRTSKRLHESLGKHVRLMETALKREREKVKKLSNNERSEDSIDPKDTARESVKFLKAHRPKPSTDHDNDAEPGNENQHEAQIEDIDKVRTYLSKASHEIAYHVIPASHPPPDMNDSDMSGQLYGNSQLSQQNLEEAYLQQQRQKSNHVMARDMVSQKQQPLSNQFTENTMARVQNQYLSREGMDRRSIDPQQASVAAIENRTQSYEQGMTEDRPNQAYETQGPRVVVKEDVALQNLAEERTEDVDGWNFDEPAEQELVITEPIPPHRPDTDAFPNVNFVHSEATKGGSLPHHRTSLDSRCKSDGAINPRETGQQQDSNFQVRFELRGHLDVIRSVIFTSGSAENPEICTCSDDGTIKRWIIPATSVGSSAGSSRGSDITSSFTHRGHEGAVTSLAACSPSQNISNGGRALGNGLVFSGGQDGTVRLWEPKRIDPKATFHEHKDAVWGLCVLPGTMGSVFGDSSSQHGGSDRILLASGAADGYVFIWAIGAASPTGNRRQGTRQRANSNSMPSGPNIPTLPQPSVATTPAFHYTIVHRIPRPNSPSPTCISPLSLAGVNFVVSYSDASIIVYDTRTGEEIASMASLETYDGTPATGVNSVVATTVGFDGTVNLDPNRAMAEEEEVVHGATGSSSVEGVIISGYEDRYIRFFDANSGQCTYTMLAHPAAIASLSLSPDGRELVSAGHDASLRFWNLEKRSCTQEVTHFRLMRGEGVCAVVWSRDGNWVAGGGGDGVVKVCSR